MNNYFEVQKINSHLYRIIGATEEESYFIFGKKRGLLIDTGIGIGSLKRVIDDLTTLPYDVVLTHGHLDHASGAYEFLNNHEIFLNKNDWKIARIQTNKFFIKAYYKSYLKTKKRNGTIDRKLIYKKGKLKFKDLNDGTVFDLGEIHVEARAFPGHTKGSMAFLFREDRILLIGDACSPSTFLFLPGSSSVFEYKQALISFKNKVYGKYDHLFLSHPPKTCALDLFKEMEKLCDEIINGEKPEQTYRFIIYKAKVAKKIDDVDGFRVDGKTANLFYRKIK